MQQAAKSFPAETTHFQNDPDDILLTVSVFLNSLTPAARR